MVRGASPPRSGATTAAIRCSLRAANLTPDPETGLGEWTQRNFVETIRTGRHMGRGRPVLPPMPIQVYDNFTDADLEAIYAYLRTIPPVRNKVPEPLPHTASLAATK